VLQVVNEDDDDDIDNDKQRNANMSAHPFSPMISIAFTYSPAVIYISAAVFGSFKLLAQSACFDISNFLSEPSSSPTKSCTTDWKVDKRHRNKDGLQPSDAGNPSGV